MVGPTPQPQSRTGRVLRVLGLYVITPLLLVLEIPVAIHVAQKPSTGMTVHNLEVRIVVPNDPADSHGVQPGDRVLAVDDAVMTTMVDWDLAHAGRYDLAPRTYLLERDGVTRSVTLEPRRPRRAEVVWSYGLSLAGLGFLGMGWLVFRRRHDMVSRFFFGLCALFAFLLMDIPDWPSSGYMTFKDILRDLVQLMIPVVVLRFFIYFPDRIHLTSRGHRRHRLLWLPALPLFSASLVIQAARMDPASSIVVAVQQASGLYFSIYMAIGLAVFTRKVFRRGRPLAHAKLRMVLWGLLAGFLPFIAGVVLHTMGAQDVPAWQPWTAWSLVLVPLSFGLAILRYGALDVEDIVRHGLVYGMLTLTVVVVYGVLVGVVGVAMTRSFQTSNTPVILAASLGVALALNPLRHRMHEWVDRAFFPGRRATREALGALSHEFSVRIEGSDAPEAMLGHLHDLYRPTTCALFLERDGRFRLHAHRGDLEPDEERDMLPADATLPRVLRNAHRPVAVEELDGLDTETATDEATMALIDGLDARLLIPLITGSRLVAFLVFGPKHSGTLYSQSDVTNLHDFSIQAAALVEIGRLYRDNLRKERLETEMSVAQRIQESLVPDGSLVRPGLELLGRMVSCREVGGDSFDYFPLDDDTVGLAIADAAGKGVPAALVMTSLRAAFRSSAKAGCEPEQIVGELNATVSEFATPGQFICFFYATYHVPTGTLCYCNAGMNPPFLLRRGQNWIERLKKGGLVLGIDADRRYARGTLTLAAGDLLALYTDGLTEQTNREGSEFFGENRLEAAVQEHQNLPLDALQERIFAMLREFGGSEQSDDCTLMFLRAKDLPST